MLHNIPTNTPHNKKSLALARTETHYRNTEHHNPHYELPQLYFTHLTAAREDWPATYQRYRTTLAVSPDRNAGIFAGLTEINLDLPHTTENVHQHLTHDHLTEGLSQYPYNPELHTNTERM